jgi:integrase
MAGKRGNGEGSVHKRADGRWQTIVTLPSGKRKYYYGATRAEASAALTKALRELAQGLPVVAEKQTVGEYLSTWLTGAAQGGLAPRTAARYRAHVEQHLVPALGRIRLARLSAQPIQQLYDQQLAAGSAPATVRQMHAVLRRALGEALQLGLIQRNPATLVRVPRVTRTELHVLTPDDARRFLETVTTSGERLAALYVVALTTGMRLGELLALRWMDVDISAGALHVRATLRYRNADTYFFDPPKTAKSRRRIALSSAAVEAMRAHRTRQLTERLAAGPAWREEDLVFCTEIGGALCGNHLSERDFPALLARAGLPRIRFHDLRHTCATVLLRRGVHPKVVSELLGHSTVAMTLDRYSHVLPDMQQAAREAMDALLG